MKRFRFDLTDKEWSIISPFCRQMYVGFRVWTIVASSMAFSGVSVPVLMGGYTNSYGAYSLKSFCSLHHAVSGTGYWMTCQKA